MDYSSMNRAQKIVCKKIYLVSENENYEPIEITEESEFEVWGVVTRVIKKV